MTYLWVVTSFLAATGVYLHASGREASRGPMMSIFLRRKRSPLKCAVFALIGGPFGLAEYMVMCVLARSRESATHEVKVTEAAGLSGEELREFWDKRFREGLDSQTALDPLPEN